MFNKVVMIGNLTRDVELRYLPSGAALATIGLASNRKFKKQDGTMADETCFIDVKLFGRTAEVANQYLKKGSKVLIEGRLSFETWTDQMGAKKSKHTITAEGMTMLDSKSYSTIQEDSNQANTYQPSPTSTASYQQPQQKEYVSNIPEINIDEDEIPF